MGFLSRVFAVVLLLLLAGCVSAPVSQPFNRDAHAALERVEVLPMRHSEIDLMIVNNPGYHFGLIGLAIAEANRVPKRNWLRETLAQAGYDHVAAFRVALSGALEARGYRINWGSPPMEPRSSQIKRRVDGQRKTLARVDSDAQLDVNLGFVGYAAAGTGNNAPYRPTAVASVRLLSADGKQVLFEESVNYHQVFPQNGSPIVIEPDPAYRYPDFDDMEAAPEAVVEGLRVAIEALAAEIANQL